MKSSSEIKFAIRNSQFAIAFFVIAIVATSVRASCPELAKACWSGVDDAINSAVAWESIPGAVLLVGQGDRVIYRKAYGNRSVAPTKTPMTVDTIFDLASCSKVVGTATSIMVLVDQGKLRLDDKVSKYVPGFEANGKGDVTVEQLLLHRSGLTPDNSVKDYEDGVTTAFQKIAALQTIYPPGEKFKYSDVGYILLGEIVRKVSGKPLNEFAHESLFEPLGMKDTGYNPAESLRGRCAPTEKRDGHWMVGEVHDPRAFLLGGVAGHAGLFSTVDDLGRYCRMILNKGELEGHRVLSGSTVSLMTKPSCLPDGDCRGYGWDIDTAYSAPRGWLLPRGVGFGHTGFTGTAIWIDTASNVYIIFLTNAVHPKDQGKPISWLRRDVSTLVAAALMAEGKMPVPASTAMPRAARDERPPISAQGHATVGSGSAGNLGGMGSVLATREPNSTGSEYAAHATQALPHQSAELNDDNVHTILIADQTAPPAEPRKPEFRKPIVIERESSGEPATRRNATGAPARVLCGIDVLPRDGFKILRGKRIALITNHTGLDRQGRRTVDVLRQAPGVKLAKLFSPEHGLYGKLDEKVGNTIDAASGLQVFSLYGETRRLTPAMFEGIDVIVYDIQDIGARYYTYPATLGLAMEEAAKRRVPVIVLDRPNPITGTIVDGPIADQKKLGFTAYMPMPVSHGMTIGELAAMFNGEKKIGCDLTVVPIEGWRRGMWWDETGLMWVNPSPNMRNLNQALLYLSLGLLESSNISVGRGTDQPFELFGSPWMDGRKVSAQLNAMDLPGLRFYPIEFQPNTREFRDKPCQGVFVVITDRRIVEPVRSGLTIAWVLNKQYGSQYQIDKINNLMMNAQTLALLKTIDDPAKLPTTWKDDVRSFMKVRQKYLMYR